MIFWDGDKHFCYLLGHIFLQVIFFFGGSWVGGGDMGVYAFERDI